MRRATGLMLAAAVLLVVPLSIGLFSLMIVNHDKYESQAIDNQTRSTAITADRGVIYDRNMNVLAASTTVENVFLDPLEISQAEEDVNFIAQGLSSILDVDATWIAQQTEDTKMRYKVIAKKQPQEVADQVREFISTNGLTGIHLESDSQRYYPHGMLASQLLGFTNATNEGAEGLEAYYDDTLQGTAGAVVTTKGNYETEMLYNYEKYYEATDGYSLVLAVDATVQYYLEKNLQAAIEKYDVQNGAFAIMMDVNTGAVLGMATLGGYDPNNYLEITDEATLAELAELETEMNQQTEGTTAYTEAKTLYNEAVAAARLKQWRNRNVSDGYEPGSTFKTITLAAALEEGAVSLDSSFYCGGAEDIPGREQTLHCWKATGHGAQQTPQALQNSCNIAFAHIGLQLGGEKLYQYVEAFGLMEKTGIDTTGEAVGYFYDEELLSNNDKYGTSYLTTASFGQSFKVTPIQLVRAISAVVNGGYLLKPYVVDQVLDSEGNVVQQNQKTVLRQVISEDTSAIMCQLMESVVTDGTAGNAALSGYRIGGKTGTSEKLDVFDENGNAVDDKIVSFVGVAPMDDPQYIVLVALDTPSTSTGVYISGGVMAAPVTRDIFADTLPYLGVQPDYSQIDMATVNVEMPAVTAMTEQEAKEALAAQSLTYIVVGEGQQVTGQIPEAGAQIPGNSEVILYMGEEVPKDKVTVPDLTGMSRSQANNALTSLGLYLQTKGSTSSLATVTSQDISPGTEVARGTTITAEYTDHSAQD